MACHNLENQAIIDHDDGDYYCIPCQREFISFMSIVEHCRFARIHNGDWCDRCDHLFVSPAAHRHHVQTSMSHWICPLCMQDLSSRAALKEHNEDMHYPCSVCKQVLTTEKSLQKHLRTHFVCRKCGNVYMTENERDYVRRRSAPAPLLC